LKTPVVWEVKGDMLLMWRDQQIIAEIPRDLFPALILTLAEALKK